MAFSQEIMDTKTNSNLIPSYASMNEAVFYVLEENERNFSQMIKNLGLKELAVYESTGTVLLYEEGTEDAKQAEGEKVSFVAKAWANLRAAFEACMKKIGELAQKVGVALQGMVAKASTGVAAAKTKKKSAEDLKAQVANLSDDFLKGLKNQFEYKELGGFKPTTNENDVASSLARALSNYDFDEDKAVAHSSLEPVKKALGVEEINPESVKKAIRGETQAITKEAIEKNFADIYATVTDQKAGTAALKTYFKSAKELYDKAVKAAKKAKNDKESLGSLKAVAQATSVIYTTILSEYYSIIMRNAKIVLKLNALANKGAKDAKKEEKKEDNGAEKKESKAGEKVEAEVLDKDGNVVEKGEATHTESAVDSEIESLFNWSF